MKYTIVSTFFSNLFNPEKMSNSLAKKEESKISFDWQYLRNYDTLQKYFTSAPLASL